MLEMRISYVYCCFCLILSLSNGICSLQSYLLRFQRQKHTFEIVIHTVVRENCMRMIKDLKDLKYSTRNKKCTTEFQILIIVMCTLVDYTEDLL